MKMGTSQKQNIAVQHRTWNMNQKPQVMHCIEWRNDIFKQMIRDGARIQYSKEPELFVITWPGKESMIATPEIIEAEWRRVHLRQKVPA
jgi:hypothetical protein